MDIWNVLSVGQAIQTTAVKTYANKAWKAVIDVAGTHVDVILKDESSHRLAKEMLALGLADQLNVPHITGWIVSIDQTLAQSIGIASSLADPNDASRKLAFGSKLSHGVPIAASGGTTNSRLEAAYRAHVDAVRILVFDELLGNFDRQYENIMNDGGRFSAFDHDKILFSDTANWSQLSSVIGQPCLCSVSDDVGYLASSTKPFAQALATAWGTQIVAPIPILAELIRVGLLSAADAQAIEQFLLGRLQQLASLVGQHYP